jgi:hypothetical protein
VKHTAPMRTRSQGACDTDTLVEMGGGRGGDLTLAEAGHTAHHALTTSAFF